MKADPSRRLTLPALPPNGDAVAELSGPWQSLTLDETRTKQRELARLPSELESRETEPKILGSEVARSELEV